jgi:hypothetical protein
MKNCTSCQNEIDPERIELLPNTLVCSECAKEGFNQPGAIRAFLVFGHKTGGDIEIVPESTYELHKKAFNRIGQQSILRRVSPSKS